MRSTYVGLIASTVIAVVLLVLLVIAASASAAHAEHQARLMADWLLLVVVGGVRVA